MRRLLDRAMLLQRPRILKYRWLSTCPHISGTPTVWQPVVYLGPGRITMGAGVQFGWPASLNFHTGYCHLEVTRPEAAIEIGDGAELNNDVFLKSEGPGIRIGARALIGSAVCVYDSDFHELHPARRRVGRPAMGAVELGENVFIGDGVKILKGVTIGADTVVGAGSVVVRSLPAGVVAAGNPARVVRALEEETEDPAMMARSSGKS